MWKGGPTADAQVQGASRRGGNGILCHPETGNLVVHNAEKHTHKHIFIQHCRIKPQTDAQRQEDVSKMQGWSWIGAVAFIYTAEVTMMEKGCQKKNRVVFTQRQHNTTQHNTTYRPGQLTRRLWGSAAPLCILRSGRTICRERRVVDNEGGGDA